MEHYSELRPIQHEVDPSHTIFHIRGSVSVALISSSPLSNHKRIWVDEVEIFPEHAFGLRPFYECNFEWGKNSGAPSYTAALAICLTIFKDERIAANLYGCFREEFVQCFPDGDFETDIDLTDFLNKYKRRLHPHLYSCFCSAAIINSKEVLLYKNPKSGEITVNLVDNYTMQNDTISNIKVRELNERKQRLMLKMFAKDKQVIKGASFEEVMLQVEDILSRFYWRSMERILKKQLLKNE